MLWQLLRGCGGKYSAQTWGYNTDDAPDEEIKDLDPVDPELAGKANISAMKKRMAAIKFVIRALLLISSLTHFIEEVDPPSYIRRVSTSDRWSTPPSDHRTQLLSFGLIACIAEGLVRSVSTYFAVGKSDGSARSIFNGKQFSIQCKPPPPTNLPDITRVLITLEEMCRDCSQVVFLEGDIRHYFHQLKLESDISRYFCLLMMEKFYRWCCLPMGFSYSPFVAQSVAMGMILTTLRECGYTVNDYLDSDTPPAMIIIRDANEKIEICACVWYDNILIACRDPQKAPKIHAHFEKVADEFHIIMKSWNLHGPRAFNRVPARADEEERKYPSYLGLEFCRIRTRDGEGNTHLQLHWRIDPERLKKWSALEVTSNMSCRQTARICGAVMWRQHIGLTPLCRHEDVIEIIRTCGKLCNRKEEWDTIRDWSASDVSLMKRHLGVATTTEWFTYTIRRTDRVMYAATDSSKAMWGSVCWSEDRRLVDIDSGRWVGPALLGNIFVKELTAAVVLVEKICARFPMTHIFLLVDNTAAASVLRRLASSTHVGSELARRVDESLSEGRCSLEVVHITSEQNPADDPSRNKKLDPKRVEALWSIVDAHKNGRHIQPTKKTDFRRDVSAETNIRHDETSDDKEYDSEADDHEEWASDDDE